MTDNRDCNTGCGYRHKLRINLFKMIEYVLCDGDIQQRETCRFFWKNVTCPKCRKIGGKA